MLHASLHKHKVTNTSEAWACCFLRCSWSENATLGENMIKRQSTAPLSTVKNNSFTCMLMGSLTTTANCSWGDILHRSCHAWTNTAYMSSPQSLTHIGQESTPPPPKKKKLLDKKKLKIMSACLYHVYTRCSWCPGQFGLLPEVVQINNAAYC